MSRLVMADLRSVPPPEGTRGSGVDPELSALPAPRRPFRTFTLLVLAATAVGSLALAVAIRGSVAYALRSGPPLELGDVAKATWDESLANAWAHVTGGTGPTAAEYHRPLDPDTYRLVPALGASRLFVELRIPKELPAEHYLPPGSFVGRLVPIREAGPDRGLYRQAIEGAFDTALAEDAWILEDGKSPAASRWALGLLVLLVAFFGFSCWGIVRLVTPPRAHLMK